MILAELCELSRREGLLTNPDYEPKPVAWIIAVGPGGDFLNLTHTVSADLPGRKPRAKTFSVPRRAGRTSGPMADFLVDKSEYVLGIEPDGKRSEDDLCGRRELFRQKIQAAREATGVEALCAVSDFLGREDQRARAAERLSEAGYASNDLLAFELRGDLVHELPEVQAYFSDTRRTGGEGRSQCLVCGRAGPAVDKHPPLKIPGGTTSGIALVSFNSDAFESYGLSRNENAPICRECAEAYTTALTRLLSERYPDPKRAGQALPKRFVRLSPDTTAVFWADRESSVLDLLTSLLDAPQVENVGELIRAPQKGRMPGPVSNRFYCLILSGGQGRAVLRGMHTGTVEQLEGSMRAYFESVEIGAEAPMPLWRLLASVVLQGKLENLPPGLAADVFVAIVFEREYPRSLLARAVGRCRAEQKVTRERAALLRSYLIRNLTWEVSVGLDKNSDRPGYRLGRLMAVLERIQGVAQKNPNKTIVDRYYSAASTRPGTVFPRLVALAQHHFAKLDGGLAVFFQKLMAEVVAGVAEFPPVLNLEEQGLFALGYYHQRQEFFRKSETPQTEHKEEA